MRKSRAESRSEESRADVVGPTGSAARNLRAGCRFGSFSPFCCELVSQVLPYANATTKKVGSPHFASIDVNRRQETQI